MNVKKLVGHSGCKIELVQKNNRLIVKKTSKSIDYNQRLFQQCLKQMRYANEVFRSPKVLNWGYEDELFVFEMEYINGISFYEYFRSLDLNLIAPIAKQFLESLIPKEIIFCGCYYEMLSKIESLNNQIGGVNEGIEKSIDVLRNFSWDMWSVSKCHGDLTFENIIYDRDKFYLIDFLDSFAGSWIMDIAKIFQDLEVYWSYRNGLLDHNVKLRCHLLKNMIINRILMMENGPGLVVTIYHLLLLNLLRIIPYIRTDETERFVNRSIEKVLLVIQQMVKEYDYGHLDNSLCGKIDKVSEYET